MRTASCRQNKRSFTASVLNKQKNIPMGSCMARGNSVKPIRAPGWRFRWFWRGGEANDGHAGRWWWRRPTCRGGGDWGWGGGVLIGGWEPACKLKNFWANLVEIRANTEKQHMKFLQEISLRYCQINRLYLPGFSLRCSQFESNKTGFSCMYWPQDTVK